MSKDRTLIAKGVPRNRNLVRVDDTKDTKRILTYDTEAKARSGFIHNGFYSDYIPRFDVTGRFTDQEIWREENLEAVPVIITIEEIVDDEHD
jgi:hypothetical protein